MTAHSELKDLGVVVVHWNTGEMLKSCVAAYIEAEIPQDNIVIVDQGSRDPSWKSIERLYPNVRTLVHSANQSYAHAVNIGVKMLQTPFVAVSNADVLVQGGSLQELMTVMSSDSTIALVGCKTMNPSGKDVTRMSRTSVTRGLLLEVMPDSLRGTWRSAENAFLRNGSVTDVTYIEGAFFIVRREAYETIGGMDEGFSFFFEDADLPMRAIKAGYRTCHVPSARVTHVGGASFSQVPLRHSEEFHKNMIRLYRRHALRRAIWLEHTMRVVTRTKLICLSVLKSAGVRSDSASFAIQRNLAIAGSLRQLHHQGNGLHREAPLVSVIVPTRNRPKLLRSFIDKMTVQTYRNFELIVVDQSDAGLGYDSGSQMVGVSPVQYIRSHLKNRSFAKNAGMRTAQGGLVMFCDDDIVPPRDLVEKHVHAHQDASIGGVSCRVIEEGLPKIDHKRICRITFFGEVLANFQSDTTCYVETLVGGNMSVKRAALEEVGYFDAIYKGTSVFEEPDFSSRLKSLGYQILFTNATSVVHIPQSDGSVGMREQHPAQYYHDFHHNEVVYFLKNRNHLCLFLVVPFCLLRSIKQSIRYKLSIREGIHIFSGVFEGFRTYYRSLR